MAVNAPGLPLRAAARLPRPLVHPRLRFMTCGSVDDGKSTLIGRLLLESGAVFEDHLAEAARAGGVGGLDLSFLVDGLKAEREQGITIDVAYRYFATAQRAFLIADAPGHEQYTGNQAAAASQTELAVLLVSAIDGILAQTRRHLVIAALFGVPAVIICVNKMDLVGHDRAVFDTLAENLRTFALSLNLEVVAAIPISAREGDNVVARSTVMDWYAGPTLLEALEAYAPPTKADGATLLPIQLTGRFASGGRVSYGTLAAGSLKLGQGLQTDSGHVATVARLWSGGREVQLAGAGEAVAVELTPEVDLGRGAVLAAREVVLVPTTQVRARLIWLSPSAPSSSANYDVLLGTSQCGARVTRVEGRLDLATLDVMASDGKLTRNDVGVVRLGFTRPIAAMPIAQNRTLGAFVLVDRATRATVAAGVVLTIDRTHGDTPWQEMTVKPGDRARLLGQKPQVVWLTGLSSAGKSTIADLLDRRLHTMGIASIVLDGDNLRNGLNSDLGFSDTDRTENVRRVGEVAALMADAGLVVIVALISPFAADREKVRDTVGGHRFMEVFVDAPLDVCRQRDAKGLYARAQAGVLDGLTGIGSGYEPPTAPDLHIATNEVTPNDAVALLEAALRRRGTIS